MYLDLMQLCASSVHSSIERVPAVREPENLGHCLSLGRYSACSLRTGRGPPPPASSSPCAPDSLLFSACSCATRCRSCCSCCAPEPPSVCSRLLILPVSVLSTQTHTHTHTHTHTVLLTVTNQQSQRARTKPYQ